MYKLFTHNDLDGLGCAILAKLAFHDNVEIEYCTNPQSLAKKLFKMHKERTVFGYNLVFVTDCSIPVEDSETLSLIDKHNKVRLFDHHKTAEGLNSYEWANVHVELNNRLTCGTELWYEYLKSKSLIANRDYFVEQVRLYDTWDWSKNNNNIPKYLNDVVYILGLSDFVDKFSEKLKKHDVNDLNIFNQYERDMLISEQNNINKFVRSKKKSARIVSVGDKKMLFSFGDRYQSMLGNELCNLYKEIDLSCMVNLDEGFVSFRSVGDTDCSSIAQLYNGGGHKNASGGEIDEETINKIITLLLEKIGEINSIKTTDKIIEL